MRYKVFGPDAEVYGGAMMAFVQSINYTNFSHILQQHGLEQVHADQWYPQQVWMDVFSDIASQRGSGGNLVSIGMKIIDTAPFPPEIQALSFTQIMAFSNQNYLANNRGKDVGSIEAQVIDDQHLLMIDKTPYPDDFVYGAYYAMARRFLGPKATFSVKFDEEHLRRDQSGSDTRVHIIWQWRNTRP